MERKISTELLPALEPPRVRPERFNLMVCHFNQLTAPFPEVVEGWLAYWTSLHARPWTLAPPGYADMAEAVRRRFDPFRVAVSLGAAAKSTPGRLAPGFEGRYAPVINADGTAFEMSEGRSPLCPTWMAEDPDGLFEAMLAPYAGRLLHSAPPSAEAFFWDFEPTVNYCYCSNCLARFAAFAGLDAPPDAEAVQTRHVRPWFDFRVRQHADIQARTYAVLKRHFPDQQVWICTDPLHAPPASILSSWCGVDERLGDAHCDVHTPMPYYAGLRYFDDIAFNREQLKKPIFPLNDPAEKQLSFFRQYTPRTLKQNILATAALGCMGYSVYPDDALDGRYLAAIREAFGLAGAAEPYYAAERDDGAVVIRPRNVAEKEIVGEDGVSQITLSPPFHRTIRSTVHRRGGGYLVSLFNYDKLADAVLSVQAPSLPADSDPDVCVTDLETGWLYTRADGAPLGAAEVRAGFLTPVPRDEAVLLKIAPGPARPAAGTLSQADLEQIVAEAEQPAGSGDGAFPEKQGDTAFLTWGALAGSTAPSLVIGARAGPEAAAARVFVDIPERAAVTAWKPGVPPESDYLQYGPVRGRIGELVFYHEPRELSYAFDLRSLDIRGAVPEAVFACRPKPSGADPGSYSLAGLEIVKTLTLEEGGTLLRTRYEFRNVSEPPVEIPLGFRIKNIPAFSGSAGLPAKGSLCETLGITVQTPEGPVEFQPTNRSALLLPEGARPVPFVEQAAQIPVHPWVVSPIVLEARAGGKMILAPDPELTRGVYIWTNTWFFTIEFLSEERNLAPGETAAYTFTARIVK